jgi:hypothetical protein
MMPGFLLIVANNKSVQFEKSKVSLSFSLACINLKLYPNIHYYFLKFKDMCQLHTCAIIVVFLFLVLLILFPNLLQKGIKVLLHKLFTIQFLGTQNSFFFGNSI